MELYSLWNLVEVSLPPKKQKPKRLPKGGIPGRISVRRDGNRTRFATHSHIYSPEGLNELRRILEGIAAR